MFGALGKILNNVQFGPHERKVKKYLDEATTDSVLQDLGKALAPRLREVKDLWTIFDAYCVEDSSQQRYWNEDSLRKHIESRHPDVAISKDAIRLLWRCFHLYAYHPFPRDATDGRIDSAAFQRAVSLLAVQSTDLLGTQDGGDYFWRHDDAFFRQADFKRIFRSIGLPKATNNQSTPLDNDYSTSILDDAMDVLAMTQPQTVSLAPSPDQLEPAARKLLREGLLQTRYHMSRKDLSTFLSLLLRLRLRKAKWGSRFHFGAFDKADPADEELANILVNGLGGRQEEEYLTSDHVLRAMDLLPNLELRFYQLWAVLFQPPMTADEEMLSPEGIPRRILGAISLFISYPRDRSQTTTQDMRIALERFTQSSQRSDDMTATRLVKSLAEDPHPHVVLVTGDETATAPVTVLGAYFPGPLWLKPNGGEEKRELKTGTSHLLFQLKPQFRLLRWTTSPHIPLTDIINIDDDDAPSLEAIAASDETSPKFSKPYRIGDPDGKSASLRIDPETKSATLTSNSADANSSEAVWYKDMCTDGASGDKAPNKNWKVTVNMGQLDIFSVSGGIDENLASGKIIRAKDQARYRQEETKPKVEGEELRKRIQGFGST